RATLRRHQRPPTVAAAAVLRRRQRNNLFLAGPRFHGAERHPAAGLPGAAGSTAPVCRDLRAAQHAHRPVLPLPRPEPGVLLNMAAAFFRRYRSLRLAVLGAVFVLLCVLAGLFGSTFAPYDPVEMDFGARLSPPGAGHLFGTDEFGRDIFSRILHGASVSVRVALIAVSISTVAGVLLGALAGYLGGWTDEVIMRFMDLLFAFPAVLLAITVMAILGRGVGNAMIAIAIV